MKAVIAVPATLALVYRAWSHKSLTTQGIIVAALTAVAHAIHPWSLPFTLLCVFFLAGTRVTKIKKDIKAGLTIQSNGNSGGEGARTHIQVLANSAVASILTLLHAFKLSRQPAARTTCYPYGADLLLIGIVANYAAVAADTFSSELGILSKSKPRLITSPSLRQVPPGTNGGVTIWGLVAGFMGSAIMVMIAMVVMPFCDTTLERKGFAASAASGTKTGGPGWTLQEKIILGLALTVWGGLGSVLDSLLGGWLQESVVDTRSGRIVEAEGGQKVLVSKDGPNSFHLKKRAEVKAKILHGEGSASIAQMDERLGGHVKGDGPSRVVESGRSFLDNNEVNLLMAAVMSLGAMQTASWYYGIPFNSLLR